MLNESFIVLTIGASLIANFGLLANNEAVVIGAMVVDPWILPLQVTVFAVLSGEQGCCHDHLSPWLLASESP